GAFRAGEVRRSLRSRAEGPDCEEIERHQDRGSARASERKRDQSDGCSAPQREGGAGAQAEALAQARCRSEGNALADRGKEGGARGSPQTRPLVGARAKGGVKAQQPMAAD